jgi:hypothetical protein
MFRSNKKFLNTVTKHDETLEGFDNFYSSGLKQNLPLFKAYLKRNVGIQGSWLLSELNNLAILIALV